MAKDYIVRSLLRPILLGQRLSSTEASTEVTRRLSVETSTPEERLDNVDFISNIVGLLIVPTMAIFGLLCVISNSPSISLRLVITPLIFFFTSFLWLARRTIPAAKDAKKWKKLKESGELHLYAMNDEALRSVPKDRDFILPTIATTVISSIILISGILVF